MTKEERLLRQEQRERAKAIEAAAREAGRGPLDLPYLLLVLTLVGVGDHAVFRQFPLGLL